VLAVDETTGALRACPVTACMVHPAGRVKVLHFSNGRSLRVTPNHPIYAGGRWVPAGTLGPDHTVYSPAADRSDLRRIVVSGFEPSEPEVEALYDITVEDCHNFFAESILAHNKPP
jgi:intein/homing endonuclease